jgi:inositol oxygenase
MGGGGRYVSGELRMLRYHSFYAAHKHAAHRHLMNQRDEEMFAWVGQFNPYDLYSKGSDRPKRKELLPYYEDLVAEFFPAQIDYPKKGS